MNFHIFFGITQWAYVQKEQGCEAAKGGQHGRFSSLLKLVPN